MVHINHKKTGHQLLVIYGGRNDKIYEHTGSAALNDICIYNINLRMWEAVAMIGQLPMSRWNHSMVAQNDEMSMSREGFMIFGGTNLSCVCTSKIFTFDLVGKKQKKVTAAAG